MAGQFLDITQRATCLDNFLGKSGHECPAPAVRGCSGKAQRLVVPVKPDLDGDRAHSNVPFAVDDPTPASTFLVAFKAARAARRSLCSGIVRPPFRRERILDRRSMPVTAARR